MRFHRTPLTVAAAGVLAVSMMPVASAASSHHTNVPPKTANPSAVATTLTQRLGARSAGSYLDPATRKLVVTITSAADAATVRAAGAVPRRVARSAAQLRGTEATLSRSARVVGTAWSIDPSTDQVVVSIDSSVSGAGLTKITAAAKSQGSAVRVRRMRGRLRTLISGGDAIWGSGYRCSDGFNVTDGTNDYFLTAGHCGNVVSDWYADSGSSQHLATTQSSSFPGTDYSIARYDGGVDHPSSVDLYNGSTQSITQAADAYVGETVTRSGSTSGVHSGTVNGLDATVNYSEGTVNGLIDTNVCAEPGDSGGSLFDGSSAVGLTSGGSGDCTSGGETFFQPVTAALSAYGVSIG
jgi:streptogrisin D